MGNVSTDDTTLQERLEVAAKEAGISVAKARADIRQLTGLSRATMTHWWTGKAKEPRAEAANKTAQYLGVNPLWLARGIGPKREKGKRGRTMPIPNGVTLEEEEIAAILRLFNEMDHKLRQLWLINGRNMVEAFRKASPTNPYGRKGKATRKAVTGARKKTRKASARRKAKKRKA